MKRLCGLTFGLFLTPMALAMLTTAQARVPTLHCHRPTPPPKEHPTSGQVDAYNKALPRYRKCIQAYVSARSADAKKYSELAQENADAANAAIKQFNDLIKEVSKGK